MAKALKRMLATQLEEELGDATGLLVVDTGPMTVENVTEFRKDLREKAGGARLRIIHNRTARVALNNKYFEGGAEALVEILRGPSAVVYGGDGAIPIAKVVRDWRKKFKELTLKAAIADGELLEAADAEGLAEMPDLPQLKAMMAAALISPARGIAGSLQGVYGGLARVIQARVDEGGGDGEEGGGEAEAASEE